MENEYAQIESAATFSVPEINVNISEGGSIIGQGIAATEEALQVAGGNLDGILRSFNGIDGGALSSDASIGTKAMAIMDRLAHGGSTIYDTLKEALESSKRKKKALNAFLSSYGEDEIENNHTLRDIKQARSDLATGELDRATHAVHLCLDETSRFKNAIRKIDDRKDSHIKSAGQLSLLFTNVNSFNKLCDHIVHDNGRDIIARHANDEFLKHNPAWKNVLHEYGIAKVGHGPEDAVGGSVSSKVSSLASRLTNSRSELVSTVNQFVTEFGVNMSALVKTAENLALAFGKSVALDETTGMFLHTFERMNEFTNDRNGLYKHLLVLDSENVSSAEIKQRFLASMTDLGSRAKALGEGGIAEHFAQACMAIVDTINRYSDKIKTARDTVRANGGSTASMNELYGLSSTQLINITGMNNAIEELKVLLSKIQFFRNIAAFRSNLRQTTTELTEYTKDYPKSVGTAVGEAISKIKREKNELISQIDDSSAGLGLEIDMYNSSTQKNSEKISKDKLKEMIGWQYDARIGLYKTVEAIDMYLLHFTETISNNPDSVTDLHKMLTATRIIAKWYDKKAGENIVKMFESLTHSDDNLDKDDFIKSYQGNNAPNNIVPIPDVTVVKVLGDNTIRVFQRCRRAIEGVLVLKNIISYFIGLGEKYGDFKSEKTSLCLRATFTKTSSTTSGHPH